MPAIIHVVQRSNDTLSPSESKMETDHGSTGETSRIALAVVFASFVVILILLYVLQNVVENLAIFDDKNRAVILPRVFRMVDPENEAPNKRKLRTSAPENALPNAQMFKAWRTKEHSKHPEHDAFDTKIW